MIWYDKIPSDIFDQNVNIRESRRARRVEAGAAQLEDGEASEGESDDEYWNVNTLE